MAVRSRPGGNATAGASAPTDALPLTVVAAVEQAAKPDPRDAHHTWTGLDLTGARMTVWLPDDEVEAELPEYLGLATWPATADSAQVVRWTRKGDTVVFTAGRAGGPPSMFVGYRSSSNAMHGEWRSPDAPHTRTGLVAHFVRSTALPSTATRTRVGPS